jgi:hypothetical protein
VHNLVTVTGSHKYRLGPPDWGLGAGLTNLLFKKTIVAKSEGVKTGWSYSDKSGRIFYGRPWHKKGCFADDDDDDDDDRVSCSHCRTLFSAE